MEVVSVRSAEKTLQLDSGETVSYDVLVIAMSGKPDMHMPEIAGVVSGMGTFATHMTRKRMAELDIPGVSQFLDIIKPSGGYIYACKLAMEMFKLEQSNPWDDTDGILTVGQFYERYVPGSQIVFI
ncbi:DsrE/DsrF/DrsH-like family protein [Candidatus Saccharibacteria bacterium]|nr:MAG: DsrE/DsrF/DrsH-like family protein [Candidatus Saccharibacteria bacterium]